MSSAQTVMIPAPNISLPELQAYAQRRFSAAANLLETLSCTTLKGTQDQDLARIADALQLLLRDGCDAMDEMGWRLQDEAKTE